MYLPLAPGCMAFVTSWFSEIITKLVRSYTSDPWHGGPGECITQIATKDQNESYYSGASRASELRNLLSHHHRNDGEGVHKPEGATSEVEGKKRLSGMTRYPPLILDGLHSFF